MTRPVEDAGRSLRRGFAWLGGSTAIARIVDVVTTLVLLTVLTKQQVGVASLVISFAMILEALNGLGTGEALIQARSATRLQRDTVFWYVLGAALLTSLATVLAAPLLRHARGFGDIAPFLVVVAIKQPLVGAAVVPLAMLNRTLQYQRIAIVNVCATLGAALTRLVLGACGFGAWALVIGYAASGLFTLAGAMVASPFRPRLRWHMAAIRPLTRFGVRAASANMAEQMFKNVDYLLIGGFYGAAALAVYRVAFEVAMEPAMAIGAVVGRTALPVLARLAGDVQQRGNVLRWSLQRVAMLVAPLAAGVLMVGDLLAGLLHDGQGHSYAGAGFPLRILAVAAVLRVMAQILSAALLAAGRPELAARMSAAVFVSLTGGIVVVGATLRAPAGLAGAAAIWLCTYPAVLAWGVRYLRRDWTLDPASLAHALGKPLIVAAIIVAAVELVRVLLGAHHAVGVIAIASGVVALAYAGSFLNHRPFRQISPTSQRMERRFTR